MLSELGLMIATFTSPEQIGTTPGSMFWMFPLLASVAIIYKATKLRVIFLKKFLKEIVVLFFTISIFMILVAVALHIIVWLLTG